MINEYEPKYKEVIENAIKDIKTSVYLEGDLYSSLSDAVSAAEEQNLETAEIEVYVNDECEHSETLERNQYSNDLVYSTYSVVAVETNEDGKVIKSDMIADVDSLIEAKYIGIAVNYEYGLDIQIQSSIQTLDERFDGEVIAYLVDDCDDTPDFTGGVANGRK